MWGRSGQRGCSSAATARTATCWLGAMVVVVALALPGAAHAASISAATIGPLQAVTGVACASASTCYAVGADQDGNPAVITLTNGVPGTTANDFSDENFLPTGIVCPSGGSCLAYGYDVDPDSGNQVGAEAPVNATTGNPGNTTEAADASEFDAFGCSSESSCLAAGQDQSGNPGTVAITQGQPQSLVDIADQEFNPGAVACSAAGRCLVAGEDGLSPDTTGALDAVTNGTPAAVQDLAGSVALDTIGCWSATGCTAGGAGSDGTDSDGDTITVPTLTAIAGGQPGSTANYPAYADGAMTSVSCAGTTCLAIGDDEGGDDFAAPVADGKPGQAETLTDDPSIGPIDFSGLACPTATRCLAVGQGDQAPVAAEIPVPAFAPASGTSGGGSGSSGSGSGGSTKANRPGHRIKTRLLIAITWRSGSPVRHLTVTVRCQNAVSRVGIEALRIKLEVRRDGSRSAWRQIASALSRRIGATRGEVRFVVPAVAGARTEYRAVLSRTRRYAGSVSFTKTIAIL